jgi:hypothetical protein
MAPRLTYPQNVFANPNPPAGYEAFNSHGVSYRAHIHSVGSFGSGIQ